MIDDTLRKIEERIRGSASISEERRQELLSLFGQLRDEMGQLSETHREAVRAIADHSERSAVEATSGDRTQLDQSLDNLSQSVTEFEKSHPKLVGVVNRICETLSGLGI